MAKKKTGKKKGPVTEGDAKTGGGVVVATGKTKKAKREPKPKKVSALDAAARVLGEKAEPMNCQEMIAAMAEKGYWKSPRGQTPSATLYSAMLREITAKAKESRFVKAERGKFRLAGVK